MLLIGLHALKQEVINRLLPTGLTVTNTASSTLALAISSGKTLTLTSTGDFNLTIPTTGTAALLATANAFTTYNTFTGTPPNYTGLINATAYHTTNSFINVLNFTGIVNNNTLTSGFSQLYGIDGYVQIRAATANCYNRTIAGGRFFVSWNATSPYEAKSLSGYGIIIDPPSILGTGTKTPGTISGVYIQNQGTSTVTTSRALQILDQSGSTSYNYAIETNAGNITFNIGLADAADFLLNGTTYALIQTDASDDELYLCNHASSKFSIFAATPVVQQVLATGAGATADDIITMLQTYGFCRQS